MIEAIIYIVMLLVTAVLINQIIERQDGEEIAKDLIILQVAAGLFWPVTLPIALLCLVVNMIVNYIKSKRKYK